MKRFVSALVSVVLALWSAAPVSAAPQEMRAQGSASPRVVTGLEERLLGTGKPAAGLEEGPTVEDLAWAIGDRQRAEAWVQEAVGFLPAWSRLPQLGQSPPASVTEVRNWIAPVVQVSPSRLLELLDQESPVMVLGGGHGTRRILEALGGLGVVAIGGSNVLDYGGRSADLYDAVERKRKIRPVMMGDDMNLRGEGVIQDLLVLSLPKSLDMNAPLWPQVAREAVLTTDAGETITGIPNVLAWWERKPDSMGRPRRFSRADRAALVRFFSFAFQAIRVAQNELGAKHGIRLSDQSMQNLLHTGTMIMVGAYPEGGPIDPARYLVGLHLLGEALGGPRWIIPASFQRPDQLTLHGDLATGQPHAIVSRGINTVNKALPLVLAPPKPLAPDLPSYLAAHVFGPHGESLSPDEAIGKLTEMLKNPALGSVLIQPGAYRYDTAGYAAQPGGEAFQATDLFLHQLRRAQLVVLAPGNFHESVFSSLSVPGALRELIAARQRGASVVWMLNPNNVLFTSNYTLADYGRVLRLMMREIEGDSAGDLSRVLSEVWVQKLPEPGRGDDRDALAARIMSGESFKALADDLAKQAAYIKVAHQHARGSIRLADSRGVFEGVKVRPLRLAHVAPRTVRGVSLLQMVYSTPRIQALLRPLVPKVGLEETAVRSAMQELLGMDLVRGQRWPAGVPESLGLSPEGLVDRFTRTWAARMRQAGVAMEDPQAVRAYLSREAIPWRIIQAAGRGTRVSPASLIRKPVVRPDGASTTVAQTQELVRWAGIPNVVVVDSAIAYQLLRERVEVSAADRAAMARHAGDLLTSMADDFDRLVEVYDRQWAEAQKAGYRSAAVQMRALRSPVSALVREGWHWTADPRQQGDVAQMLRQTERVFHRTLTGEPVKWVNYVWDALANEVLRDLVEDPQERFLDPRRVADVLGGPSIVVMGVPEGLGGSLKMAVQRLRERGILQEHAYLMPIYSDYATGSLDSLPNPYLIGLLAGLSNPDDPQALPRAVIGAKSPLKSLPADKGNVIWVDPAHPEQGAGKIREWRDMTSEEQLQALLGFGRSLKQQGVARAEIPKVENWSKLGDAQQQAVYRGYDTHASSPSAQPFYHALNAGVFLYQTAMVEQLIADGIWAFYGQYDYPDPDKAKLHEFWYTTVAEAAAAKGTPVRVVPFGPDSAEGLKDTGRIVRYGARRQQMVADRLRVLGVTLAPGAVVTVSGPDGRFDPATDLPSMFPAPAGVQIRGRVHLESSVRIGAGAVLDGTDRPVVLKGDAVVAPGVTVRPEVSWQVSQAIPVEAIPLTADDLQFLRSKLGVAVADGARIHLLPQKGLDLSPGAARRQALAQVFEAKPDQVWLEGTVVFEPSVRIQSGTWLNGRHRPVILRGRTFIGQGRLVEASELNNTMVAPLPELDTFNYPVPRLDREADVFNAVLQGQRIAPDEQVRNERRVAPQPRAGVEEEWYQAGREQVQALRGQVDPNARVLISRVWDEPAFSGWLGSGLQVRGRIEVNIESDRLLVQRLAGDGPSAHRTGEVVTLFQAKPGLAVVVPPGTVLDEQVFQPAVAKTMAASPFRSDSPEQILLDLSRQQSKAGALVLPEPGLPAPRTFPGSPYQLTLRPGRARSISPVAPSERLCPLCAAQWADNEAAYRRGAYLVKPNKYPSQEGDMVWIDLQHRPQGFSEQTLRGMVASSGGAANDPVVEEAGWLIQQLLERKDADDPGIQGINVIVAGPGFYRTAYNDFNHRTAATFGASIPEHAHFQGTPRPLPIEQAALDPIHSVGLVSYNWVRGWAAPIFAVRSPAVTLYVVPRLSHNVPSLPADRAAYLQMGEPERDASGHILVNPAAWEMAGSAVTADRSSFKRAGAQDFDLLLSGAASPQDSLRSIEAAIRRRTAPPTAGLEEHGLGSPELERRIAEAPESEDWHQDFFKAMPTGHDFYWWFPSARAFIARHPAAVTPSFLQRLAESVPNPQFTRFHRQAAFWLLQSLSTDNRQLPSWGGNVLPQHRAVVNEGRVRLHLENDRANQQVIRHILQGQSIRVDQLHLMPRQGADAAVYRALLQGAADVAPQQRIVKLLYPRLSAGASDFFGVFADFDQDDLKNGFATRLAHQDAAAEWMARLYFWTSQSFAGYDAPIPPVSYATVPNAWDVEGMPLIPYVTVEEFVSGTDLQELVEHNDPELPQAAVVARSAYENIWRVTEGTTALDPKPSNVVVRKDEAGTWRAKVVDLAEFDEKDAAAFRQYLNRTLPADPVQLRALHAGLEEGPALAESVVGTPMPAAPVTVTEVGGPGLLDTWTADTSTFTVSVPAPLPGGRPKVAAEERGELIQRLDALNEDRLVVISAEEALRHPELAPLADSGHSISLGQGNAWIIVLPKSGKHWVDLLYEAVVGRTRPATVHLFGSEQDRSLRVFRETVTFRSNYRLAATRPLLGNDLAALLSRILALLADVAPDSITADDLARVEALLGLGSQV